jgi:mannitol/fructose-specific phosphotransferase system IIA component (Ntr-type)
MISLSEILLPEHINLGLDASDESTAVEELLFPLRGDIRINNWDALRASVLDRAAPAVSTDDACGIVIAHGRTNAVNSFVMAAGRSPNGFLSPHIAGPVNLVFMVGIPTALNQEYLRLIGTIARLCGKPETLQKLLQAPNARAFLALLVSWENKL